MSWNRRPFFLPDLCSELRSGPMAATVWTTHRPVSDCGWIKHLRWLSRCHAGCNSAWKVWPMKHGGGIWGFGKKPAVRLGRIKIWTEECVRECPSKWQTETLQAVGAVLRRAVRLTPAVLEAQMEVCGWHAHIHTRACIYTCTSRHCIFTP